MIRLKSILEQINLSNPELDKQNLQPIPKVLFLGDAYTKSASSYAKKLSKSKVINGRVVAWPRINAEQLVKLAKRYINDSYSIVSVMFGDIVKQKLDLEQFTKSVFELKRIATRYGAKLIIVQNPYDAYVTHSDYLDAIKQLEPDLIINVDGMTLQDSSLQTNIATDWVSQVREQLNFDIKDFKDVEQLDFMEPEVDTDKDKEDKDKKSKETSYSDVVVGSTITANYSDSVVDQAYDLIIPFEGFTATPKIDTDGYCRIGHGSSHITKENGSVINLGTPAAGKSCAETYPYTITIEDAHRDLRRLIPHTFLPVVERYVRMWGGDITKFNDATVAALISVAYNYGHVPSKLKAGIAANDAKAIGEALLTNFNSKGENPSRRKREGQYIIDSLSGDDLWSKAKDFVATKFNRKGNTGSAVTFSSKAQKDLDDNLINPNLIDDLKKAAEAAGVTIKVGTAKTGHDTYAKSGKRSRHADGLAVDIIEVNGLNWNTKDHAIRIGAYEPLQAFTAELQNLGYTLNNEYNIDKAILTFGFKDHSDHMHVSRRS